MIGYAGALLEKRNSGNFWMNSADKIISLERIK
jgi:hypothetical protein